MTAPLTENLDARDTPRGSVFLRFVKRPLGAVSLAIVIIMILVAVLAPLLAPHDPNALSFELVKAPPSWAHPLGGDSVGRDVLSRLIYGTQATLWGAFVALVTSLVLGVPSGVAAGYFGGVFDRIGTWISDALQSVPGMVILLVVAAGSRNNFNILMITVGVFMVPGYFRLTRSITISVRSEAYVDAAKVAGLGNGRILSRHVVRTVYAPVIIQTALTAGMAMAMQAGLQFLGIGSANQPAWGAMMNEGFQNLQLDPLLLLWPSLALGIAIAALAIMGSVLAEVVATHAPVARRRRTRAVVAEPRPVTGTIAHAAADSAVQIENLRVSYDGAHGPIEVVHGITLDVAPGEVLGIVGESGSGKSQTVFSVLDLLPAGGHNEFGSIWIGGRDVTRMSHGERRRLLGSEVGYIPQEPMTNLDPAYTVGRQLTEPLRSVHGLGRKAARARALEVLARVGIADPERVMRSYAHELSGGMAQRVLIAGAIAARPAVLVADEPTTALDVTVQAEVLELLRELQQEEHMALIIVTHNFGVVADICDRVAVMKQGAIVEVGDVSDIFNNPHEAYTRELIAASLDGVAGRTELDAMFTDTPREADARPLTKGVLA